MAKLLNVLVHQQELQVLRESLAFADECKKVWRIERDYCCELYKQYGAGYMYTAQYMPVPYNERRLHTMLRRYKTVIVVTYDANVIAYTYGKHTNADIERQQLRAYIEHKNVERKREKMFKDVSGEICRKRQGQGRDLSMLGQYCKYPVKYGVPSVPETYNTIVRTYTIIK